MGNRMCDHCGEAEGTVQLGEVLWYCEVCFAETVADMIDEEKDRVVMGDIVPNTPLDLAILLGVVVAVGVALKALWVVFGREKE